MKYYRSLILAGILTGLVPLGGANMVNSDTHESAMGPFTLRLPAVYTRQAADEVVQTVRQLTVVIIDLFGPQKTAPWELVVLTGDAKIDRWVGRSLPDWVRGVAIDQPAAIIVKGPASGSVSGGQAEFHRVLLHEMVHLYLYRLQGQPGSTPLPAWFHEGLAVHVSEQLSGAMYWALVRASLLGAFYTLDELEYVARSSIDLSLQAYAQSLVAIQELEHIYGAQAIPDIISALSRGGSFERAFIEGTGETLADFQVRYRSRLEARYNIVLALAHPRTLYLLLPLLVLAAYLIKRRRANKILRSWELEGQLRRPQGDDS